MDFTIIRKITVSTSLILALLPASLTLDANPVSRSEIKQMMSHDGQRVRMITGKQAELKIPANANQNIERAVAQQFGPHFGVRQPDRELKPKQSRIDINNRHHIRYQQMHQGIPVLGGELIANLNASQQLENMAGKTTRIESIDLNATVSAQQAINTALTAVSKWHEVSTSALATTTPQLHVYDPSLLGPGKSYAGQRLVWQLEVTPVEVLPFNEFILIDATTGIIVLHFNQVDTALSLNTYDVNNGFNLPGTLVCDQTDPGCNGGGQEAKNAHQFGIDTYNFFFTQNNRDSLDGNGMTIVQSVNYGSTPNAFWNGTQAVYGPGLATDDVVAHELTHGFTDNTSNLFYYYQSGAINESLSDMWGEFVDLTNTSGTDNAATRWQMGEDSALGPIRNMANPPLHLDPDKMTSPLYHFAATDNGGVHINSGINNKAVSLMVDGGLFNGRNITGIGIEKTAAIYYEVQTNHLVSGSDYLDLYNALNEACRLLIGFKNITQSDCTQVNNAALAVEMNLEPAPNTNPEAELCPAGAIATDIFNEDFEAGLGQWETTAFTGTVLWRYATGFSTSGQAIAYSEAAATTNDAVLSLRNAVSIPATDTYYLRFNHSFDYDFSGATYYDGGVIEYSIDSGATWLDAGSLIDSGRQYVGQLDNRPNSTNPLPGRDAFVAVSHGFNSTRLNLSTLSNNNLLFRFRSTADQTTASFGWVIDDVRIYRCVQNAAPVANAGPDQNVLANVQVTLSGSATDSDGTISSYQWQQIGGPRVTLIGSNSMSASFTSPASGGQFIFQLTVTDNMGATHSDSVTINVNGLPTANAGPDQTVTPGSGVSLNGSGSDPESGMLTYSWTQNSGTASPTLTGSTTASASFSAPDSNDTLSFTLTVTDDAGQSDSDTVTIQVQQPSNNGGGLDSSGGGCSVNPTAKWDPASLGVLLFLSLLYIRRRIAQISIPS